MTGSDRLFNSTEASLRAPYAAPRDAAHRSAGASVRSEVRSESALLMPFVPREFRDSAREVGARNVTVVPTAERTFSSPTELRAQNFVSTSPDSQTPAITRPSGNFGAIVETESTTDDADFAEFLGEADSAPAAELPWIDAFAADEPEVEDEWPMGEAGKRLDELTQSLTSLDASRARQEAGGTSEMRSAETTKAEHTMWNEEEWIDIMPTPMPSSTSAELNSLISNPESVDASVKASISDTNAQGASSAVGAESAARALEGLAQRVRAGQVQVPAFKSGVADEAVLAGLLASMLGWRQ